MPIAHADDGVSLSYSVRGDGPRNLLFMHGWAGSGSYFQETIDGLDLATVRAIAFDMRGHGDSDKPDTELTLDRLARDALTVADDVGAKSFIAVGYSMSGKFAQYLALVEPERIEGLVLVAGAPAGELPLPEETVADWLALAGDADGHVALVKQFMHKPVAEDVLERFGRQAAKVPRADLERTLELFTSSSFGQRLGSVRAPALVVGGAHDPLATVQLQEAIVSSLPSAWLEVLGCGHEIPLEEPTELAALIGRFATRQRQGGAG